MLLGMTSHPAPPNDRTRFAAVTRSLGDGIQMGQIPTPDSITIWKHSMPLADFMTYADRNGATITVVEDNPARPWARLKIEIGVDLLPTGGRVEMFMSCNNVSDQARAVYAAHNKLCAAGWNMAGK